MGFELGRQWEGYRFVRVVDGDTVVVQSRRNGEETRLRLVGINSPETNECFSEQAKFQLGKSIIGKKISYKIFGRDGFGRYLGIVYANNTDVSQDMIASGAAVAYNASDVHDDLKPSKEYFEGLKKLEEEPKVRKIGIWSDLCLK
jgi:endonuclease YncB( thermonuclease family)